MRIVTFAWDGGVHHGVRGADHVRLYPGAASAVELAMDFDRFEGGDEIKLADVKLLAPVPKPGKVVCIGLNYRAHALEGGNPLPGYPAVFLRGSTSLVGPDASMILPECSDQFDFEAELGVIIGRAATSVRDNPLDYIAGYCCFNDGSVRNYQRKSTQWTAGKNFDLTGAFSADLVTPDELPLGASGLRITSRLNGCVMQDSNTEDMIFSVATLITILSEAMTLEPGDVIATGTPAGVGYARKPPVFMREGDRIEVEIDGIGNASNPIARRSSAAS